MEVTILKNNEPFGPYTLEEINLLLMSGRISENDAAYVGEDSGICRVGEIDGVKKLPAISAHVHANNDSGAIVFLLAVTVGILGAHRFYTGRDGTGVIQLLLTLSYFFFDYGIIISSAWVICDCVAILAGGFSDARRKEVPLPQ